MPAAGDERRRLVDDLRRMTELYFGYPARQANVAAWLAMPVDQLRRVRERWAELMSKRGAAAAAGEPAAAAAEGVTMKLDEAKAIAEGLVEGMRPYCARVEIAGSIRRRKAEVKDIEIVAVPKWELAPVEEQVRDLFGSPPRAPQNFNLLHFWATKLSGVRWIKPGTSEVVDWQPKPEGKYWRGIVGGRIKLDLFLARPDNFGLIFLIRTGSADFSQGLVTFAKHRTSFRVGEGSLRDRDGKVLETFEERDVFDALRLDWVEPELRDGAHRVTVNGHAQFPVKGFNGNG
jgi:DNA polymerase/3'-5' exonuclease PolX